MSTSVQTDRATIDEAKIASLRAELPAVQAQRYLNTGTNGPLPRRAHDAIIAAATREFQAGRIGGNTWEEIGATQDRARAALATLLGCAPEEIALTHNTTEGMNIALLGVDWQPGDEVITSSLEHPGGLYPVYLAHQRFGARIRMTRIGQPNGDPVAELRAALTGRTRAVVLSHVSWASGMVLPLRELADLAHDAGALFICDAAQGAGMVPAPVYELGVDAYACSGQKWLCGPDGTGALFVRRDRLGDIRQSAMGYASVQHGMSDYEGHFVPPPSTSRYEAATLYPPSVAGLAAGLDWLAGDIGWDWVYARIAALGQYCYEQLAALPGVTVFTPREAMAGLVHFTVAGIAPADLTACLAARNLIIRHTPDPAYNRVSTGFYNTEAEIDELAAAIGELAGGQ
ncbi:MAG: aminotransferase class V-fold PLP-dependent enzyme [Thermomicrobiales bacterium]